MILFTHKTNNMAVFFDECELKKAVHHDYDASLGHP